MRGNQVRMDRSRVNPEAPLERPGRCSAGCTVRYCRTGAARERHPAPRRAGCPLHLDPRATRPRRRHRPDQSRTAAADRRGSRPDGPRGPRPRPDGARSPDDRHCRGGRPGQRRRDDAPGRARRGVARQSRAPRGRRAARTALLATRTRTEQHAAVGARIPAPTRERPGALERRDRSGQGRHPRRGQRLMDAGLRRQQPRSADRSAGHGPVRA